MVLGIIRGCTFASCAAEPTTPPKWVLGRLADDCACELASTVLYLPQVDNVPVNRPRTTTDTCQATFVHT